MFSIDGTFLVIFVSFVIFMLVMKGLYFDPLLQIKHTREEAIDAGQQAALTTAQQLAAMNQAYYSQLTEARHQSQKLIQAHREQAKTQAAQAIQKARAASTSQLAAHQATLKSSREDVYTALQQDRQSLVDMIVQKVSGRQPVGMR